MPRPDDRQFAAAGRYIALGSEFGVSIVAGVVAGWYLDEWLGTAPLFLLVLAIGAFAGALYRMIRSLDRLK